MVGWGSGVGRGGWKGGVGLGFFKGESLLPTQNSVVIWIGLDVRDMF